MSMRRERAILPDVHTHIAAGEKLGVMGSGYSGLHFELYELDPKRKGNSRWYLDEDPPEGLLNPVNYVQAAAGDPITRQTAPQRHEALKALGLYAGQVFAPWTQASKEALRAAQKLLNLAADGIWGPKTEKAIAGALIGKEAPLPADRPEVETGTTGREVAAGPFDVARVVKAVGISSVILAGASIYWLWRPNRA